jgi:hypothetical protein
MEALTQAVDQLDSGAVQVSDVAQIDDQCAGMVAHCADQGAFEINRVGKIDLPGDARDYVDSPRAEFNVGEPHRWSSRRITISVPLQPELISSAAVEARMMVSPRPRSESR